MLSLPAAAAVILLLLTLLNVGLTCAVVRMLRRPLAPLLSDDECPPGLVVLCLRGGDEFLDRSLRLLFRQDYPRYRVRVVLDSADDPARQFVDRVMAELRPPHVEVVTLAERHPTCTYKMSGILWGTRELPPGTEFVALMDGDTVPHRTWLRELATPLIRGGALCSTGNRWFFPEVSSPAAMVRSVWGASALLLMTVFRIPWGGTMAVRREVIQDERVRERLRHAFSEDTTLGQFVEEIGGRVHIEPRLIILNREQIGLGSFFRFEIRQLLAVRLQHRCWKWMALHGLTSLPLLAYPLARLAGMPTGQGVGAAFLAYSLTLGWQSLQLGAEVRRLLEAREEELPTWSLRRVWHAIVAVPATLLLHWAAVVRALGARRVMWRGVHYRIGRETPLRVLYHESPELVPEASRRRAA